MRPVHLALIGIWSAIFLLAVASPIGSAVGSIVNPPHFALDCDSTLIGASDETAIHHSAAVEQHPDHDIMAAAGTANVLPLWPCVRADRSETVGFVAVLPANLQQEAGPSNGLVQIGWAACSENWQCMSLPVGGTAFVETVSDSQHNGCNVAGCLRVVDWYDGNGDGKPDGPTLGDSYHFSIEAISGPAGSESKTWQMCIADLTTGNAPSCHSQPRTWAAGAQSAWFGFEAHNANSAIGVPVNLPRIRVSDLMIRVSESGWQPLERVACNWTKRAPGYECATDGNAIEAWTDDRLLTAP